MSSTRCKFADTAGRTCIYGSGHQIRQHVVKERPDTVVTKKYAIGDGRFGYVDDVTKHYLTYDLGGRQIEK
ncbi:hypothetical protein [Rhodococcoides fascians]|uniref:hypothetical protein n=1 Tax=Rhodococcoides fascians TaxID=1828 RepID=UPI00050C54E1|nr:hypothetical protein [Rhodococcus fascians]